MPGPYPAITDRDTLMAAVVEGESQESEVIDFKREVSDASELVRRIAAFANHRGGVVLIGVAERGTHITTAGAFVGVPDASELRGRLHQSIRALCRPVPEVHIITVPNPHRGPPLVAVNIEPIAHGAVAVQKPGSRAVMFPMRTEHGTDYMNIDEVTMRLTSSARAAWIQLSRVWPDERAPRAPGTTRSATPAEPPATNAKLVSAVYRTASGHRPQSPVWDTDIRLVRFDETTLVFELAGTAITVPLRYVDAVWRAIDGTPLLALTCAVEAMTKNGGGPEGKTRLHIHAGGRGA